MDDDWGYPHFRKPPHMWLTSNFQPPWSEASFGWSPWAPKLWPQNGENTWPRRSPRSHNNINQTESFHTNPFVYALVCSFFFIREWPFHRKKRWKTVTNYQILCFPNIFRQDKHVSKISSPLRLSESTTWISSLRALKHLGEGICSERSASDVNPV